jgi:hypothetical protein
MDKMRKRYEEDQKSGDFLSFEKGQTLVYIHPQCRPDDEWEPTANLPFVPVAVHYGLGSSAKQMAVSLDSEANPIIDHPYVKAFLKKAKKRLTGGCPVATALRDGTIEEDAADESRRQSRYLWGMTPLKHRTKSSAPWSDLSGKPSVAFIGKQIHSGIMDLFMEHDDITDPSAAILVRIERTGDSRNTKYKVTVESSTLKTAFVLPKSMKSALAKAIAEGGDCDLFRITSNLIKPTAEVQAMVDGVAVETDPDENDEDETPKKKKAKKPEPEDDDEEEADDEPEADEDDDDEPPPKKPAKSAKPAKKPEPEEDDDEDDEPEADEDDDDEPPAKPAKKPKKPEHEDDDEPPAKPAKPAKKKPAPEPEEDEDEADDEDDDEEADDEDDEPPPPKKPAKPVKSEKPSKPAKPAADDEEEDLEDMEAALADLEPDEDETPKKPKKKK